MVLLRTLPLSMLCGLVCRILILGTSKEETGGRLVISALGHVFTV